MRTVFLNALTAVALCSAMLSCQEKPTIGDIDPDAEPTSCQIKTKQIFSSPVLGKYVRYNIILPPKWDKDDTSTKYPIIYLLHGAGMTDELAATEYCGWVDKTQLGRKTFDAIKAKRIDECIIVTPQAWNSFYMNWSMPYETFFFNEFMPYIEKEYHAISDRKARAVAGLSMGGFGSFYYGYGHNDLFCYVYTMSMADGTGLLEGITTGKSKDDLPFLSIAAGTNDATVGDAPKRVYEACQNAGFNVKYEEWGGGHDWTFWDQCVDKFLYEIGQEFKKR